MSKPDDISRTLPWDESTVNADAASWGARPGARVLAETGGNQTRAAELIGMALRTFQSRVKQYGLAPAGDGRRKG